MRGLLLDLDGVFYVGDRALPGSAEALGWIRDRHIPHLFVTNTSSRPRTAVVDKLRGFGIEVDAERLLTPAVAAIRWLRQRPPGPLALFVPAATEIEFREFPRLSPDDSQAPAALVVGDLGTGWDFARLNRAFRLLMREPKPALLALGMTRYWRADDGLRLDTGPFVQALAYAGGCEPVVTGKPAAAFYQAAAKILDLRADELWMIGDDIRGDIDGAQQAGLRGILVRTGKFTPPDLDLGIRPEAVLDSIADLPDWWRNRTDRGPDASTA